MRKMKRLIAMACMGLGMVITQAWAVDYSSMSTEELAELRGTMRNASQEEHAAFQHEWQNRVRQMTREERQRYLGPPADAPRDGSGMQYGQGGQGPREESRGGKGPGGSR